MITKGIIVKIEDSYNYKVRIPIIDKSSGSSTGTHDDDLGTALVCCSPGCKIYYQPGDVVYIAFEENKSSKPVIIGQLYRENTSVDSQTVLDTTIINANVQANLPDDTTIGEVTPEALQNVSGARNNLQKQIDSIEERFSIFDLLPRSEGDFKLHVKKNEDNTYSYSWIKI